MSNRRSCWKPGKPKSHVWPSVLAYASIIGCLTAWLLTCMAAWR